MAFTKQDDQFSGAQGGMESERYDVIAKAPLDAEKSGRWSVETVMIERAERPSAN